MRSLIHAALVLASVLESAPVVAATGPGRIYHCNGDQSFTVQLRPTAAKVTFGGAAYTLDRQRSSLGQKYSSQQATLILDGDFAAFVTRDEPTLRGCNRAPQSAGL